MHSGACEKGRLLSVLYFNIISILRAEILQFVPLTTHYTLSEYIKVMCEVKHTKGNIWGFALTAASRDSSVLGVLCCNVCPGMCGVFSSVLEKPHAMSTRSRVSLEMLGVNIFVRFGRGFQKVT